MSCDTGIVRSQDRAGGAGADAARGPGRPSLWYGGLGGGAASAGGHRRGATQGSAAPQQGADGGSRRQQSGAGRVRLQASAQSGED